MVGQVLPLVRPALRGITPYATPTGRDRYRRLDANEGPPPAPGLLRELLVEAASRLSYYPEYTELRRLAAVHYGAPAGGIMPVCGADEGLRLVIGAFAGPGDRMVTVRPTFSMYTFYAQLAGAAVTAVTLAPDFELDLNAVLEAAGGAALVVLASPNNPTARPIRPGDLARLLQLAPERPILLDETYAEFCGQNFIPWIERFSNLIILRTLSKARGLPGLRCGFVVGHPAVISSLDTLRSPYNLTATAAWVGSAFLAGDTDFRERLAAATTARATLQRELARLGVPVWSSVTHFCVFYLGDAAGSAASALAEQGILVRLLGDDLSGFIRVSVTGPEDTAVFLSAFTPWLTQRRPEPIPAAWRLS
ncbi:MAG TPA: histidinol-phosphate transaminase [Acidobacteriota bacterium]|nr:histidinol-phosphate aminotransferase family protein [Acidobacteriota bacterium]HQF86297.1 histidinol-phosphate transaminase [Acidobacteriota bacterium]HQG90460.1 histidinol-phosphate transaminase [Acidobacteriota bacterium]HQK86056.1 histidinol-phosphate transaminase [Acidobacteriota bacterium]